MGTGGESFHPKPRIMAVFCIFHRTPFGWSHSNLGARRYASMASAIVFADKWERGSFQIRAIDRQGTHTIVHERY
jgi:hypothetical protein